MSKAQEFYASVYEKARELGATEVQAQLAAAQAVHESTGKSGVVGGSGLAKEHNNLFGMKPGSSWTGKTVTKPTWEEVNGKAVKKDQAFRAYDTVEDSIKDYLSRLEARWPEAFNAKTIDEAIAGLNFGKQGGYATDSKYGNKIAKTDFKYSRARTVAERRVANPLAFNPVPAKQPLAPIDGLLPWSTAVTEEGVKTAIPTPRPDPAGVPYANYEGRRAAALSAMPAIQTAPGGIIDTGRTIVDGMDYTRAAADLQPGFDRYEAGRNLSRTMPEIMSVPGGLLDGRLEMAAGSMPGNWQSAFDTGRFGQPAPFDGRLERAAGSMPAYTPQFDSAKAFDAGRFATYQPPAPNSPEKAYENAVRNSYFDRLAAAPASAPTGQNLGISAAIGGAGRPNPPATPAPSKPAAPTIASGTPQAQSLANAYATYGNTRAMAPAAPKAPTATAIDVPNSAMSLAQQYASYGMGKMPLETAVTATQASPAHAPAPARTVAPPVLEAPRTVAPRQVTPYTPPEQPAMTPEKAKALGMVPSGVPGKYMPAVPGNPAQVMRDQMGLIARNPIASIGNMIMGALQGGVFYDRLIPDFMTAPGGLFGNLQAQAAAPAARQSIGYGLTAPGGGGLGGLGGGINGGAGAFQAGGGNWGNYGSSGTFNSGFQSGSGFTYDR